MRTKLPDGARLAVLLAIGLTIAAQVELWLVWMPDPDEATSVVPLSVRAAAALGAAPLTLSLGLGWRLPLVSVVLAIGAVALAPAGPFESSVALSAAIVLAAFRAALAAPGPDPHRVLTRHLRAPLGAPWKPLVNAAYGAGRARTLHPFGGTD